MCKAFSGIIKESGDVLWKFGVDGHEELVGKHKLKDDGSERDWARFEIAPANGNYLRPDEWRFKLDESPAPTWFSKIHENEAFKAWKEWKKKLDKILIYKPIIYPFRDIKPPSKITKKHLALLKQWASVRASVGASVRASVWDSVRDSMGASVWASVRDSVWASVGDSVGDSVWASVWASVGDSVWASVRDSAGAYLGSFFNLPRTAWKHTEKIKLPKNQTYPLQPAVDLWMMGLVPSFDREKWRLYGEPKGKVLWEGKP